MDFEEFVKVIRRINLLIKFTQKELDKVNKELEIETNNNNNSRNVNIQKEENNKNLSQDETELLKERSQIIEQLANIKAQNARKLAKNYQDLETLSFKLLELAITVRGGLGL